MKEVKFTVDCFDGKPRKKDEVVTIEDHLANGHILAGRAVAVDAEGQPEKVKRDKVKPEVIEEKKGSEGPITTTVNKFFGKAPKKKAKKIHKPKRAGG